MSAPSSPAQRTRRSRKSIAHFPSGGTDFNLESTMSSKQSAKPGKKSRSKSLGPGGLEALKEASGNSQKVMPVIRSILKPVIPLSPPKPIPPRTPKTSDSTWNTSASPVRRTRLSVARESQSPSKQGIADTGAARQNESGAQIALRTEEEQQAAARTREREEAIRRRDERRKSLANRRVSFAPEATLHTWDIIETNEDATTSSEATNSTRRQSKGDTLASDFTHGTQHDPNSDNTIQASNTLLPELESGPPDDPSNLPQTRRRSIETAAVDFDNRNELSSSPGSIMADDMTQSSFVTNPEEEADDISDTDTYRDDDSTAMDIDEDEATSNSVGSGRTDETSSSSSSALDARLRQAIQQAGTQRLQHFDEPTGNDEKDDTMSVPNAIRQRRRNESLIEADFAADNDDKAGNDDTGTMEMTQAVGGIVQKSPSRSPSSRSSRAPRRRSSGASSLMDEQTMEMTTAEGFIRRSSTSNRRESGATVATEDEDMSMELTGVLGGLVNEQQSSFAEAETAALEYPDITGQMEVTQAFGRILPNRMLSPVTERTEFSTEPSMTMELTSAVGAIQRPRFDQDDRSHAMTNMDMTANMEVTTALGKILPATALPKLAATIQEPDDEDVGDTAAMDITATMDVTKAIGRILPALQNQKNSGEPGLSAEEAESTSATKSTPLTSNNLRNSLRRSIARQSVSTPKKPTEEVASNETASASPLLLLDRRASIGEAAEIFTPQGPQRNRGVQFTDPRELERELDKQREDDRSREDSVDDNTTSSLRDKINSLTPKKKKNNFKGRKSLAIGSARGLLGKRPVELDEDDEYSPKRVQGPEHSPVKSVRLPAPPSKEETTGRLGRVPRLSLGPSGNASTLILEDAPAESTTPQRQQRFGDSFAAKNDRRLSVPAAESGNGADQASPEDDSFEPIPLQDFLNLINVRFMDLETTKRRHTLAPRDPASTSPASDERKLEDCVVAGVSTIPMLELYQHSCRELKKYISEGRDIVREIESDTFEENPTLFKEYLTAAPDVRAIMDNQFKNVKAHARLLSREMWYEWRKKLLDGLNGGLYKIAEGLLQDAENLTRQEQILTKIVPRLAAKHEQLSNKERALRQQAEEFASSDFDELKEARQQLASADSEWEEKKRILAELTADSVAQDEVLSRLTAKKQQYVAEIAESQKLCDEYRGWKMSEVATLKAEMDRMGLASGWLIASAQAESLIFHYRQTLSLQLRPAAFQPASADATAVRLSLINDDEPSTQERFFLQLLSARLQALDQASTPVSDVLRLVSNGWNMAMRLRNSVSDLALSHITDVEITSDESLAVSANILLRDLRSKVKVGLEIKVDGQGLEFLSSVRASAKVIYGQELQEGNVGKWLSGKIDDGKEQEFGKWGEAVRDLETRLVQRCKN